MLCHDREFNVATELSEIVFTTKYTLQRDKKFQDMRSSMSRHNVLCCNSETQRCVATRGDALTTETLCRT